MGRELFDYAFKTYSQRWAFKHPTPADFFRTMEDASGVDLDWFWRAWFYDTDPVDISLDSVKCFRVTKAEKVEQKMETVKGTKPASEFNHISKIRNRESGMKFLVDTDTSLRDFYYYNKPTDTQYAEPVTNDKNAKFSVLTDDEFKVYEGNYYYELSFSNKGGAVMPVIIQWNFVDGTSEVDRISAYIWRKDEQNFTKAFVKYKEVKSVQIDPFRETADINESNNAWPKTIVPTRFEMFKAKRVGRFDNNEINWMQKAKGH